MPSIIFTTFPSFPQFLKLYEESAKTRRDKTCLNASETHLNSKACQCQRTALNLTVCSTSGSSTAKRIKWQQEKEERLRGRNWTGRLRFQVLWTTRPDQIYQIERVTGSGNSLQMLSFCRQSCLPSKDGGQRALVSNFEKVIRATDLLVCAPGA